MSSGWTEDPELARLRNSASNEAQRERQQADKIKRDQDAFVVRYGVLISGGFEQAADVLRASQKYGDPTVYGPDTSRPYNWQVRGQRWGEQTILLSLSLHADTIFFNHEHVPPGSFSEQWFRERLRVRVSELVS